MTTKTVLPLTVSASHNDGFVQLLTMVASVRTWGEGVGLGVDLVDSRDCFSWALGALAARLTDDNWRGGRPAKADDAERTLSALAEALGVNCGKLSQLKSNWLFYKQSLAMDEIPPNANWDICSQARRDSGWKPGEAITQEFQERALRLIEAKVDKMDERPHPLTPPLEDILADCYDYLRRQADRYDYAAPALSTAIYDLDAARANIVKESTS